MPWNGLNPVVNKFQIVFTNGLLSDKAVLRWGVSQGSILGPLLFLIYISDLTTIIYHLLYGYNSTRALIGCWAGIISCNDGALWIFSPLDGSFVIVSPTNLNVGDIVISWPATPRTINIKKATYPEGNSDSSLTFDASLKLQFYWTWEIGSWIFQF